MSCTANCDAKKSDCRDDCRTTYDECLAAKQDTGKTSDQCLNEKNKVCFKACTAEKNTCKSNCAMNR